MGTLDRIRSALVAVVIVLSLGLATAVTLGILMRTPLPVEYPAVDGRPLVASRAAGNGAGTVTVAGHALGITFRCDGTGWLAVRVDGIGAVGGPCGSGDGGFVLSGIRGGHGTWHVTTAADNRWALLLTRPMDDGANLQP